MIDPNSNVGKLIADVPSGAVQRTVTDAPSAALLAAKPGKRTSEFFALMLLVLPAVVTEVAAFIDQNRTASPHALIGGGIAVAGYAIARALIKLRAP